MTSTRPDCFGPYRIAGVLGRGAMGVVYRAVDERDGRPAAVKTVAEELLGGERVDDVLERFRREADIGRRLDHPGIVRVYDHGEQGGLLFLAMELVEGRDLKAVAEGAVPGPPARAVRYGVQLLEALGYAHAQRVIHRDVKLANIFVGPDDRLKLMDFGIARLADSDLTVAGEAVGSPSFMAPEQIRGDPVDARTDLFAAGMVLYVLLAGRRPFAGNIAVVMHHILTRDPPPPSQINPACPAALDIVVARALAKRPEDRWPDAAAFAAAVEGGLAEAAGAADEADEPDADATGVFVPPPAAGRPSEALPEDAAADRLAALLAESLDDAVTERRLAAAAALVERCAQSAGGSAALRRAVQPVMVALAERILTGHPGPAEDRPPPRPDWRAAVRLFALLRPHGGADAIALQARIGAGLVGACYGYAARLNALLFTEAEPDVTRISMDLLRLDVLQLALEDLGAEAEARHARQALCGFAGQVVARANALIGAFLAGGDALARFGVANLLVSVEDLIGIADRLFDYGEDPSGGAADAVGQAVIADFADKAARLVELVAEEALAAVEEPGGETAGFTHSLEQLGSVYLFATRLRDPRCRDAVAVLVRRAQAALNRLGEATSRALDAALEAPPEALAGHSPQAERARAALGRISALIVLTERLGWDDLRIRLIGELRLRVAGNPHIARLAEDAS